MNFGSSCDKALAILRRDLLIALRYRSGFVITAAGSLAQLAAFYYLARAVGPGFRPEGLDYFPFVLVGTGLFSFLISGMNSFVQIVQEAQQGGTLEVLMSTSTPGPIVLLLSAASALTGHALRLLFYVAAGFFLFGVSVRTFSFTGCLAILALSITSAVSIGIAAAAVQLAIQKGSAVLWLFSCTSWLTTGALFPLAVLPGPVRTMAQWIPITHSLQAMRLALLRGAPLKSLLSEISVLSLFALALLPASMWLFSWTLRRARLQGTLSYY